jgi:mannose-6-phosphate isomerase-like protein (cupin superfamily)
VRNIGSQPLRFYTIYGPPEHKDGIVHATREEAEARHHAEEWAGETTE